MDKVLKFKVGIEGLEDKIWREIEINNRRTVDDLAYTILATFDSLAYHLYNIKYKGYTFDCFGSTEVDEDDLRQIDIVTDLLGNKLKMKVSQFTSNESVEERAILKKEFADGDTLQALIAIKCLDEGVNIPSIKTAFIMASTTNPKEYIQRRGRVLRLADGKEYAEIYDFITLPRPIDEVSSLTKEEMKRELTLVKNELCRTEEFARLAMNGVACSAILEDIRVAYDLQDYILEFEEEFDYGN